MDVIVKHRQQLKSRNRNLLVQRSMPTLHPLKQLSKLHVHHKNQMFDNVIEQRQIFGQHNAQNEILKSARNEIEQINLQQNKTIIPKMDQIKSIKKLKLKIPIQDLKIKQQERSECKVDGQQSQLYQQAKRSSQQALIKLHGSKADLPQLNTVHVLPDINNFCNLDLQMQLNLNKQKYSPMSIHQLDSTRGMPSMPKSDRAGKQLNPRRLSQLIASTEQQYQDVILVQQQQNGSDDVVKSSLINNPQSKLPQYFKLSPVSKKKLQPLQGMCYAGVEDWSQKHRKDKLGNLQKTDGHAEEKRTNMNDFKKIVKFKRPSNSNIGKAQIGSYIQPGQEQIINSSKLKLLSSLAIKEIPFTVMPQKQLNSSRYHPIQKSQWNLLNLDLPLGQQNRSLTPIKMGNQTKQHLLTDRQQYANSSLNNYAGYSNQKRNIQNQQRLKQQIELPQIIHDTMNQNISERQYYQQLFTHIQFEDQQNYLQKQQVLQQQNEQIKQIKETQQTQLNRPQSSLNDNVGISPLVPGIESPTLTSISKDNIGENLSFKTILQAPDTHQSFGVQYNDSTLYRHTILECSEFKWNHHKMLSQLAKTRVQQLKSSFIPKQNDDLNQVFKKEK